MSANVYITSHQPRSGKSVVLLGIMQLLSRQVGKVGFFRPIVDNRSNDLDNDTNLIRKVFHLDTPYEQCIGATLVEALELINSGRAALLHEKILHAYQDVASTCDFVLCEGTDFNSDNPTFEFELNAEIAANINSPVVFVSRASGGDVVEIAESTQRSLESLEEKGCSVIAAVLNRISTWDAVQAIGTLNGKKRGGEKPLFYALPEEPCLARPSMADVRRWAGAEVLWGSDRLDIEVSGILVAAMQGPHFLDYIEDGSLVITPWDRSDIILATLCSRQSSTSPKVAGLLLTGGGEPHPNLMELIRTLSGPALPVLRVDKHTYLAAQSMAELHSRIEPENDRKLAAALGLFESNIDVDVLSDRMVSVASDKVTPKMFEFRLIENAKACKQRIVLPEGEEERILRAAEILERRQVADITLLGDAELIRAKVRELGLELGNIAIAEPACAAVRAEYAQAYYELRKNKGVCLELARDLMLDPTFFATMMVCRGDADGMVSGAVNTTQHTIRPAFQVIKTKPGHSIVSSVFLMCLKDRVLVYGDCAVNPEPTAEQLAEIAVQSSDTARIFGIEPRVAMLSYSTGDSGKGANVDTVREATRMARERRPGLPIEGPIQYDAAVDPEVARSKMPGSEVAGRATVFIFPDLNTGNNTYKAVQRAANAVAIGPVLQGLNKPVNDLSRGCTVPDIVNTVALTAMQAQTEKDMK